MNGIWTASIALAGGFAQSCTGFGYAIICMALWPFIMPFRTASILEVITAFVMVIGITIRLRKHINFKLLAYPLISSTVTSTIGVFVLLNTDDALMKRILGISLVVLAVYFMAFSHKIRMKPTRRNGLIAGAVSGLLGGLFNIGGPPMVAYFLSVTDDKKEYSSTLQCYFMVTTVYIFFMHLLMGNFSSDLLPLTGFALAGMGIGTFFGLKLFERLSIGQIRKVVYGFMLLAGFYMTVFAK